MKKLKVLFVTICLLMSVFSISYASPDDVTLDSRHFYVGGMTIFPEYRENVIYQVRFTPGYVTTIKFRKGEKIAAVIGGETARWQLDKVFINGTAQLFVKPYEKNIRTNFIVVTDAGKSYHLVFSSGTDYTPQVEWKYPMDELIEQQVQDEKDSKVYIDKDAIFTPEEMNYNYKIKLKKGNNKIIVPTQVFDNGSETNPKTYIKMQNALPQTDAPVLYILENGKQTLVNYRVSNGFFIVDRFFDQAELVNDQGKDLVIITRKK